MFLHNVICCASFLRGESVTAETNASIPTIAQRVLLYLLTYVYIVGINQHQKLKGKPFWILLKQDMMGGSGGPYANHLHLAADR